MEWPKYNPGVGTPIIREDSERMQRGLGEDSERTRSAARTVRQDSSAT
jgi:hypothetical protein